MQLFEKSGRITHIPTVAQEVFDVSGAGDTVISTFTLGLCCGGSLLEAAHLANYAAGIVVGKVGTAVTTRKELSERLT
jgi:D-beta-D-heptose 7-phosphate kinase/D-beta-D-heptose 1-phosphate adenosyltransferase